MTTQTQPQPQPVKRPIDLARERLKLLSEEVADLVQNETFYTVNDAIMEAIYKDDANRVFKGFKQWKNEGYQVRKGEKAYLLWAKPKEFQRTLEAVDEKEKETIMQYFPIAYLFSNAQVDKIETTDQEPTPDALQEELEPITY